MAKNDVFTPNGNISAKISPLINVPMNTEAKIVKIDAGFRAIRRLTDLGLVPGTVIKVVGEAPFRGPLRILVRGTQLALGRGLAAKVFVRIIGTDKK